MTTRLRNVVNPRSNGDSKVGYGSVLGYGFVTMAPGVGWRAAPD
ncbi:MAG TPA: hypothetical protein VER10_15225 [Mycobacterium sp.]|nr:hypothetical protein [Mycobacterium sp.]